MSWRRLHTRVFSRKYLLVTNTVVSLSLEGLSDYTQQRIERNGYQDWKRTGRMMVMGAFFGPVEHFWYKYLDAKVVGNSFITVCKKVVLDEAVFGSSSLALFYYGMAMLEGRGNKESMKNMMHNFWPSYKVSITVWPIAQLINFLYLPPAYRVVYLNVINYLWCIYLSYMQHRKQ